MRTLMAVTSAALILALVGAPAQAIAPVPTTAILLPAEFDIAASYEQQTICDPTPRPGTTALQNLLLATYGPATIYIPRSCTSSTSEHFDGRALDWMRSARVPAEKVMADTFLAWLLAPGPDGTPHAMARRLGIMYVIWDSRMIRMYDPARSWTEYRGCLDPANAGPGLDTTCHRNHVHISMSWDGAAGITSWWTGAAQVQPNCPAMSSKATPGAGGGLLVPDLSAVPGAVPVTPTVILDTRAGVGAGLTGSCRSLAGRALYPTAAVPGLIPPGVGAAVLQVTSQSNAPATLAGWSPGAVRPRGQVATPIGTTTATVVVPLASDGSVALGTSLGAANISATVIGYAPGGSTFPVVVAAPAPSPAPTRAASTIARPSKPRAVSVTSARRSVTTRWKAPSTVGGAALTGYRVQALTSAKRGAHVAGSCSTTPKARGCTIKGLKKGRAYWMSVSVSNPGGTTWAARKKVRVR